MFKYWAVLAAWAQRVHRFDLLWSDDPRPMRHIAGQHHDLTGAKLNFSRWSARRIVDLKHDPPPQHHRHLLFRMHMDGKDRSRIIDITDNTLFLSMMHLSTNTGQRLFCWYLRPGDQKRGRGPPVTQKMTQPASSTSAMSANTGLAIPSPQMK